MRYLKSKIFVPILSIAIIALVQISCQKDILVTENEIDTEENIRSVKGLLNDPQAPDFLGHGYDPLKSMKYGPVIFNDGENYKRNTDLGQDVSVTDIYIIDTHKKLKILTGKKVLVEENGIITNYNFESPLYKEIKSNTKIDESHFIIVAAIKSKLYRYELVGTQKFTNEASNKLNSSLLDFSDSYGLMYVKNVIIGGISCYYYQFEINNLMTSSTEDIKEAAKAEIGDIFCTNLTSSSNSTSDARYMEIKKYSGQKSSITGLCPQVVSSVDDFNSELSKFQNYINTPSNLPKLNSIEVIYKPYSSMVSNCELKNKFTKRNTEINNYSKWSELYDEINYIYNSSIDRNLKNASSNALNQIETQLNNAINGTNSVAPSSTEYKSIFNQWKNENSTKNIQAFSSQIPSKLDVQGKYGQHAQGGGISLCDINGNGKLDMVTMQVDNPSGYNNSYISVGWDLGSNGRPVKWTKFEDMNAFRQKANDGGDVTVADVDKNGKMDLIVFVIDDAKGYNNGYYKIGYDMNTYSGKPARWSNKIKVNVNWNQKSNDGAGIIAKDIDGNGIIDFLIGYTDAPSGSNKGYYNIGWNIKASGQATSWSNRKTIQGSFYTSNAGCGITIGDITGDGKNDLISFYVDNTSGTDKAYFRVGESINQYGNIEGNWHGPYEYKGNYGGATDGAGVAIGDINKDGKMDIVTYYIDDSNKYNQGWCDIKLN